MTKDQKVDHVENVVKEARKWFSLGEFSEMFLAIWSGLENAKSSAVEGKTSDPIS